MKFDLISLVIPCFNEVETVEEFYRRSLEVADSLKPKEFEFIFVDDGSTDDTPKILKELSEKDKRVKVLHLAQNMGHQIALTAGMDYASGDAIVTIDADLQHPPEVVREMLEKIEGGADIVHAKRSHRAGDSFFKFVTARFFYMMMRYFSGAHLIENCGDFRAFTRSVLEAVSAFRSTNRFLRGSFVKIGFSQCVITYESQKRYAGKSKYSCFKMLNLAMDGILGFSATPIRVITWLSILLWTVSLWILIDALIAHYVLKITMSGWTTIIFLLFFFTGIILLSIAVVGSYVGRIFLQGQNPPLYWLSDARNIDLQGIKDRAEELREIRLSERILKYRQVKDD